MTNGPMPRVLCRRPVLGKLLALAASVSVVVVLGVLALAPLFLPVMASSIGKPGGGYSLIQDEGSPLPQRAILNMIGSGVACADNAPATDCTFSGSGMGGYDQIQDEGMNLTQFSTINFTGAGITCTDGMSKTDCDVPGGGGGGATPLVDTFAVVAGSPCTASQLGLLNDSIYQGVCTATDIWSWLWGSMLVTPPSASGWTWSNQGGSSVATVGGTQVLTMPGSANQWRNYLMATPATPYTAFLRIVEQDLQTVSAAATIDGVGVCFGDGSGKFESIYILHQNSFNSMGILVEKWTNTSTFSASAGGNAGGVDSSYGRLAIGPAFNFRLVDDGVNISLSFAADGRAWVTLASEARTTFFAAGPTTIGVCARLNASAQGTIVTIADVTFQ